MPDKYREILEIDAQSCPVNAMTWSEIQAVGSKRRRRNERSHWTMGKRAGVASVAAVVLCGGVVASGFVSPAMAQVLKQVPVVGSLWPNFSDPVVQSVSTSSEASATDQGITVSIPHVYYDKNKMDLQYSVKVPSSYSPVDGTQMRIDTLKVNGADLRFAGAMGDDKQATDGQYQGDWDVQGLAGDLPNEGTLSVTIDQIGNVKGNWKLSVPISSKAVQAGETSFAPTVSKTYDGLTLTVTKVTIGPVSTIVEYQIAQPIDSNGHVKYDPRHLSVGVFDENGKILWKTGEAPPSSHVDGNTQVDDVTVTLKSADVKPTALTIKPNYAVIHENHTQEVAVPYTGQFPIVFNEGDYGTTTVTGIEFLQDKTLVTEQLGTDTLEHPPVWFEDASGHKIEQTGSDSGKLVFPAMNAQGLKVCSQTGPSGGGAWGESKPIAELNMNIPVQ